MNDQTYEQVRKLWNHIAAHSVYEASFVIPFQFVVSGPDGMILVAEYRSLDQEPTLLLQHFPTSEKTMSLPQNITLFCREVPPVHVQIVLDERAQQPKAIWRPIGRRRIDYVAPPAQTDQMELARGRATGGRL